jgi:hypothetical protein
MGDRTTSSFAKFACRRRNTGELRKAAGTLWAILSSLKISMNILPTGIRKGKTYLFL